MNKRERITVLTGSGSSIGKHFPGNFISLRTQGLNAFEVIDSLQKIHRNNDLDLVHFSAIVGDRKFAENIALGEFINIQLAELLAKEIFCNSNSTFHFVSTGHVYGQHQEPCSEKIAPNPQSLYAESKYLAEQRLLKLSGEEKQNLHIYRVFSVLGHGMSSTSLSGAIFRLLNDESKDAIKYSDDIRDFLSPSQVALLLSRIVKSRHPEVITNICSGIPITVKEACLKFANAQKLDIRKLRFEPGVSSLPYLVGDPEIMVQSIQ